MYMHSAEIIAIVMVLLFYLVILGGTWVLVSFGPYRMAKHAGIPRPWLALLPVGNAWILGLLAERSVYAHTQRPRRLAFWNTLLQALPLASLVLLFPLALADWDFNPLIGKFWFASIYFTISATVVIPAACSSSTFTPKASSKSMMSSTTSKESAFKSSPRASFSRLLGMESSSVCPSG